MTVQKWTRSAAACQTLPSSALYTRNSRAPRRRADADLTRAGITPSELAEDGVDEAQVPLGERLDGLPIGSSKRRASSTKGKTAGLVSTGGVTSVEVVASAMVVVSGSVAVVVVAGAAVVVVLSSTAITSPSSPAAQKTTPAMTATTTMRTAERSHSCAMGRHRARTLLFPGPDAFVTEPKRAGCGPRDPSHRVPPHHEGSRHHSPAGPHAAAPSSGRSSGPSARCLIVWSILRSMTKVIGSISVGPKKVRSLRRLPLVHGPG
jgi:hypothetical protein